MSAGFPTPENQRTTVEIVARINMQHFRNTEGVLRCSVVECLTRNTGVLDATSTGSSGFFLGMSLGKALRSPSLVMVKPGKDMNNLSWRRDMTEILLKQRKSINQSSRKKLNSLQPYNIKFNPLLQSATF